LSITKSLITPPEKIEQAYSGVAMEALESLSQSGIYLQDDPTRDRPAEYDGQIPKNLDMLSNDELASLMVVHQSWTSYLNGCHSGSAASLKTAERALKGVKASITQERGKDYVLPDPRYIEADARVLYHEIKTDIISDILRDARNNYQLMSRLITLREQDMSQTTRRNVLTSSHRGRNR
jgi:hypothetical protein